MPRFVARRSKAKARKSKLVGRRRVVRKRNPSTGSLYLKRRLPLVSVYASTTSAGLIQTNNASVISLGIPVAAQTGGTNYLDVPFSMTLQLDQLQSYTDITNIADRYRIMKASVKVLSNPATFYSGAPLTYLEICNDRDDNAAPTVGSFREKMGIKTKTFNNVGSATVSCYPVPAMSAYQSGITTAYTVPSRAPYFNMSYPSVPHYCLKGIIRNMYAPGVAASAATVHFDINVSVHARDIQ